VDEILRLENVEMVKSGKNILNIDYIKVEKGDRIAIIGPNGAGKSTLLKVMGLMEKPTRGNIFFKSEPVDYGSGSSLLSMRRRMSAVFQRPLLLNTTVYNNASIGLRFRGITDKQAHSRVKYWMQTLGIWDMRNQPTHTLSGGEAQRLSIVRALCTDPEVMFFDEPFAALDAPTKEKLQKEFKNILDSTGITSVLVTHDFTELPMLSHKTAVVLNGKLEQLESTSEVLTRPQTVNIARFVGMENIIDGFVEADFKDYHRININGSIIKAKTPGAFSDGEKVSVCIRPEKIKINTVINTLSDENQFDGEIIEIIDKGHYNKIRIDCGFNLTVFAIEGFLIGKKVTVSFAPESVHIISL
jgi:tungstate transport system ATP-binding protein